MTVDVCARCGGIWLDRGELELFPDRPSEKTFLAAARLAPGRCRRKGHSVPRGMTRCSKCESPIATCPACQAGLATVVTPSCSIEICSACQGVWLDAGELEAIAGVQTAIIAPSAKAREWEIPEPSRELPDHWAAPGQTQAVKRSFTNARTPFACRHCDALLTAESAWAFEGEIYCQVCRPPRAVSGRSLPSDVATSRKWRHWNGRVSVLGRSGLRALREIARALVRVG